MYAMQCLLVRRCLIGRSMQFPLPSGWIRVPHFNKGCNMSLHQSHCPGCDGLIMQNSGTSGSTCCVRFTSATLLKKTTESAMEYQSTPNRWVCAHLMQSSMMSSSKMEEASSRVPSLLVMETTNNLSCTMSQVIELPDLVKQ